jgi:hypothetical protein
MAKLKQYDRDRIAMRNGFWPDAGEVVYDKANESGWGWMPRTMPLIGTLQRHLGTKNDPSRVYLALWARQRGYGFVEILDSEELATECGYRGNRKIRSLNEALDQLQALGFIRVKPKGSRKYGFILLIHPHDAVQKLKHDQPKRIPDDWWDLFTLRVAELKATLRWTPPKPATGKAGAFDDIPDALDAEDDDLPF